MRLDGGLVLRGDTRRLPLPDASVDLIVTSPPYFAQRSYKDGDEHYAGQIGDEPHPQEWLEALWECAHEWWRVLKPSGSCFVNLGDKRSGSGAPGTTSGLGGQPQGDRTGMTDPERAARGGAGARARSHGGGHQAGYTKAAFGRAKSKQLLPHRFAIGCEDGLADPEGEGWIVRQDQVWWKKNGLPESVRDRTRDSHEYFFHMTRDGEYYSALDELRQPYEGDRSEARRLKRVGDGKHAQRVAMEEFSPLGALPGSVFHISTEPLSAPEWLEIDHFAAFPSELPRRLILGWSPPAICLECGEGRAPIVEVEHEQYREGGTNGRQRQQEAGRDESTNGWNGEGYPQLRSSARIVGYGCSCSPEVPPARPAVVLDPFGGTGTTAMVARALGRVGISVDLSWDYCRFARWRVFDSGHGAKAIERTNRERQTALF